MERVIAQRKEFFDHPRFLKDGRANRIVLTRTGFEGMIILSRWLSASSLISLYCIVVQLHSQTVPSRPQPRLTGSEAGCWAYQINCLAFFVLFDPMRKYASLCTVHPRQ